MIRLLNCFPRFDFVSLSRCLILLLLWLLSRYLAGWLCAPSTKRMQLYPSAPLLENKTMRLLLLHVYLEPPLHDTELGQLLLLVQRPFSKQSHQKVWLMFHSNHFNRSPLFLLHSLLSSPVTLSLSLPL